MNTYSQTTGINIYPKKPDPSQCQVQQPFEIKESCHYKSKNLKSNQKSSESLNKFNENQFKSIDKNIMSDSHYQKYMPCRKEFNDKNLKFIRKLKSLRKRKSFLVQMKLAIFLIVSIMLLKDHHTSLQLIPSVIAKQHKIFDEHDKKDGLKSPVIQSHQIEEEEGFLKNIKKSQMNDKVNYIKDFDALDKQTKSIQGQKPHQFYNFQEYPFSYFKKDEQNNSLQNQNQSKKIELKTYQNLSIETNKDIDQKKDNLILKFKNLQSKDQQNKLQNLKLNQKLQQNQYQNDNQTNKDFKINIDQQKRQLQVVCSTKVTLVMKPIDWWFRGNQYRAAEHFVGNSVLKDYNQIKEYPFDQITESIQVIQDYTELFAVTDPLCVPSSCNFSKINSFWGGDFTQDQINTQTDLIIDPFPNFGVKFVNNKNIQGSFKLFRMTCNFGGYELESYKVVIDQKPLDCSQFVSTIPQIEKQILFNQVSPFIRIEYISTELFSNSAITYCPISACTISEQIVCDSLNISSEAYIESDSVMFVNPSITLGKCSQIKVRCNFGSSGFQKESEYVYTRQLPKNYCAAKVKYIEKAIDWWFRGNEYHEADHFVITNTNNTNLWSQVKQFPFDQITEQIQVIQNYKELFTVTDTLCVPSSCRFSQINVFWSGEFTLNQIMAQTDLIIDPSPNFGVKIVNKKNILGSYKLFRMNCDFGGQQITSWKVIIDQQPLDCSSEVSLIAQIEKQISFIQDSPFIRIEQISSQLFSNNDSQFCPISNCIISSQIECDDSISAKPSSEGFIDASSPDTIKFNNSKEVLGKCSKLKVKCNFGITNYQLESYWIITNQTKQIDQCSQNQISLLDKNQKKIDIKFQLRNNKQQTLQKIQFLQLIKIQNFQCQLNYKLKQSSNQEKYIDYKDQKIQFDAIYNIQIDTSKAYKIQDLYIEIESILSGQKVYIQLIIEVSDMNPIILRYIKQFIYFKICNFYNF